MAGGDASLKSQLELGDPRSLTQLTQGGPDRFDVPISLGLLLHGGLASGVGAICRVDAAGEANLGSRLVREGCSS